ncbi:transmembrane protein 256 homolog [Osmia bicornis bicornis]|uniref:transmembrane protein 256 homolog n=1 Tax=Osmia bicornis bicornis TaxID=1437191 RepID=UPI0010F9A65D|nr:transmembrane protein 256 homolog [Osmia bicornis bicornis]
MYFQSVMSYALSGAQVSLDAVSGVIKAVTPTLQYSSSNPIVMSPLWKLAANTGPFTRIAAISGATAVLVNAYGSHSKHLNEQYQIKVFDTASRYHFTHTLVILGLPLCRAPYVTATFMLSGIILFCGSCYYYSFTGDKRMNKLTPFGGICFILGWLSMCI